MKEQGVREIVFAEKILRCENIENEELLLKEKPLLNHFGIEKRATVKGKGCVILDFGKEYCGGIRILVNQVRNSEHRCAVRIRFGESVSECCADLGEKNATTAHALRDIETSVLSLSDMTFANTGFRFVRIDFMQDVVVELTAIVAVYTHCGAAISGSFHCADETLNEIYNVAQRTIYLNLQNGVIWDGIKRDRLVWLGDMNPEIASAALSFGNVENLVNSLNFAKDSFVLPSWINNIPSFSIWYLINMCDYYRYTGDSETVLSHRDYMLSTLKQFEFCIADNGALDFSRCKCACDMPYFIDWNTYGESSTEFGVRFLLLLACRRLIDLFSELGIRSDLPAVILRKLRFAPDLSNASKPVLAMAVLSGATKDIEVKDGLISGGAKGYSSFMSFYISRALTQLGETEKAVENMKEFFGGMLQKGATSFWEDFDVSWMRGSGRIDEFPSADLKDIHGDYGKHCYTGFRHSLCHGWASWPVSFLTEEVSGIRIGKGFSEITLSSPVSGIGDVEVSCATPYGEMDLYFRKKHGVWSIDGNIPKRIQTKISPGLTLDAKRI